MKNNRELIVKSAYEYLLKKYEDLVEIEGVSVMLGFMTEIFLISKRELSEKEIKNIVKDLKLLHILSENLDVNYTEFIIMIDEDEYEPNWSEKDEGIDYVNIIKDISKEMPINMTDKIVEIIASPISLNELEYAICAEELVYKLALREGDYLLPNDDEQELSEKALAMLDYKKGIMVSKLVGKYKSLFKLQKCTNIPNEYLVSCTIWDIIESITWAMETPKQEKFIKEKLGDFYIKRIDGSFIYDSNKIEDILNFFTSYIIELIHHNKYEGTIDMKNVNNSYYVVKKINDPEAYLFSHEGGLWDPDEKGEAVSDS